MRKKLIGILICGILLMTSFSSLCTIGKAEGIDRISKLANIIYGDEEEVFSSMIGICCAYGDFYIKDGYIKGTAKIVIAIMFIPIPIPLFGRNINCSIEIIQYIFLVKTSHLLIYIGSS